MAIPKKIHFVFGLKKDQGGKGFSYFHYLNILSALNVNKDYEINFYYQFEPNSFWFNKLKEHNINFVKLDNIIEEVDGVAFKNYAHKADYLRMCLLQEHGGIYLDIDNICIRPFDDFLNLKFVIGLECVNNIVWGLPNFTFLSEPNNSFLCEWKEEYGRYYSEWNDDWAFGAVKLPYLIYQRNLEKITTVSPEFFSYYGWDDASLYHMFKNVGPIGPAYSIHLWESRWWNEIIEVVNDRNKLKVDCTLTRLYKKYALGDSSIEFPEYWS